jgi:hypothetical protein
MKTEWEIPFKKLKWRSGINEEGESKGLIYQIGEFRLGFSLLSRNYFITNYEIEDTILEHFIVYSSNNGGMHATVHKIASTFEEAKELCQKDFEKFIIESFFDLKQI